MKNIAALSALSVSIPALVAAFDNTAPAADATKAKRADPVEAKITNVVTGITLPKRETAKRGSKSQKYPFDTLEVGALFGVENKTAAQMKSTVSNANRKAMVNKTDAEGNVVYKTTDLTAADGTVTKVPTSEPEKVNGKIFRVQDVDAEIKKLLKDTDAKNATCVVIREQ